MSAAASIATPTPAPAIPFAPAGLLEWQRRQIVRSGELATAKGLHLIGRGRCRVAGHEGAPVYVVSSASRPGASHLVWIERGRIHCDCPARTKGNGFTCSHAQFVRLLLVAELAALTTPASVPPAARAVAPAIEPAPVAPEPAPVEAPRAPIVPESRKFVGVPTRCPTCRGLADSDEIEQLGECLRCLQMRADYRREDDAREAATLAEWEAEQSAKFEKEAQQQLPCWCCGAPATAETSSGLYCDACMAKPTNQRIRETTARLREKRQQQKDETARRVIARDNARTRAGVRSEASPRAGQPMKRAARAKTPATAAN